MGFTRILSNLEEAGPHKEGPHEYPLYCPFQCDGKCIDDSLFIDYGLATILCFTCIFVSLWHIGKHLKYFTNPHFQAKIIIILCMAPFYCGSSIISIYVHDVSAYLTVIRDCYEAFLLFTFFYLIFSYLAYDEELDEINDEKLYTLMIQPDNKGDHVKLVYHMWPVNYCSKPYPLSSTGKAKYFTYRCKKWVLQCFILKPFAAIVTLIATPLQEQYPVCTTILTITNIIVATSVTYSLYYLLLFYYALKKPLAPYSPLAKFLVIKITLFFTFWQALTIIVFEEQVLECFDQSYKNYHPHKIIVSIENTLICFEMLLMSLVGGPAFTFKDFKHTGIVQRGKFKDVLVDMFQTFLRDFRLIKPRKLGIKHNHEEKDFQIRNSSFSQSSIVGEFKIEMYDQDQENKKFSYHADSDRDSYNSKNSLINIEQNSKNIDIKKDMELQDMSNKNSQNNENDSQQLLEKSQENYEQISKQEIDNSNIKKKKKKNTSSKKPKYDLNQLLIPHNH